MQLGIRERKEQETRNAWQSLSYSPLGVRAADRAIYFACVNFFLFLFDDGSEYNYLRIYWTEFCNLFRE